MPKSTSVKSISINSIVQSKVWEKLFKIGSSAKFIRILTSLYVRARIAVINSEGLTEPVDTTEGVLQGDIMSAVLFALYISDFEEFFWKWEARGTSINYKNEIRCIAYVDGTASFADSLIDLRRKVRILEKYCEINELFINKSNSKILISTKVDCKRTPVSCAKVNHLK